MEGPAGQRRVREPLGGLRPRQPPLQAQLRLHLEGTGQGEHVALADGKPVALEVLPLDGGEEGLWPVQVQPLDHLRPGVHIEEAGEPGRGGLDAPPGLVDDVLPLLVLGEELGALGHRHRRLHRVVGGELEQAGGGHRVWHLKAGEVEKLGVQLPGHRVHPVHRLIEEVPKQLRQGGAGVVLRPLIPPLRGVGAGVGGHLGHNRLSVPGVQYWLFHSAPPPSEPSVT